jgi:hypothetical protein
MARFFGKVGFAESVETEPGYYEELINEYSYFGDVLRNAVRNQDGQYQNTDISVSNSISIVADERANEHFHAIRYVHWSGVRWAVNNVEVQRPRLILELGGVYIGNEGRTPNTP